MSDGGPHHAQVRHSSRRGAHPGFAWRPAADLVVWWEQGYYTEEDVAVREIVAAFEQGSGKRVELVLHGQAKFPNAIEAALENGDPPDFAFHTDFDDCIAKWRSTTGS